MSDGITDGFIYPDPSHYGLNAQHSIYSWGTAPPVPAPRLSAAGLQPFPVLFPGLQAPIELTSEDHIRLWNKSLLGNNPRC